MDKNNRVIYGIAGDGEIMRVVICDDEKVTCSEIEKMLSFFAFEKCIKLEVDVFFDGDTLTEYLKKEKAPDILFLVLTSGMNGVEVGKYIRDILKEYRYVYDIYIF